MNNNYWLSSVKMGGYKSIKSVEIDFQPGLNIIIGKNGTGKTNFLDFLDNSLKMKFEGVSDFVFDANLSYKRKNIAIHIKGEGLNKINSSDNIPKIKSRVKAEIQLNDEKKEFSRLIMENSEDVYLGEISDYLYGKNTNILSVFKINYGVPVSGLQYFTNTTSIYISDSQNNPYQENTFGYILRAFAEKYKTAGKYNIHEMRNSLDDQLDLLYDSITITLIRKYLQSVTPIEDIRLNNRIFILEKENTVEFTNLIYEFKVNGDWYFFNDLSDGTKRIVLIISYLLILKVDVFLIEEPELGIHPHQLDFLMKFLKEQSQEKQIILTTHAPQCLDILTPEELNRIIICDIENKSTQLSHLSEQKMKKARAYMKASDILSSYWRFSDLETRVIR